MLDAINFDLIFLAFLFFKINCLTNSVFIMLRFHRFKNYFDEFIRLCILNCRQHLKNEKKIQIKCKLNRKLRRMAKNQPVKMNELKKLKMNNDIVDENVSDQNDGD